MLTELPGPEKPTIPAATCSLFSCDGTKFCRHLWAQILLWTATKQRQNLPWSCYSIAFVAKISNFPSANIILWISILHVLVKPQKKSLNHFFPLRLRVSTKLILGFGHGFLCKLNDSVCSKYDNFQLMNWLEEWFFSQLKFYLIAKVTPTFVFSPLT